MGEPLVLGQALRVYCRGSREGEGAEEKEEALLPLAAVVSVPLKVEAGLGLLLPLAPRLGVLLEEAVDSSTVEEVGEVEGVRVLLTVPEPVPRRAPEAVGWEEALAVPAALMLMLARALAVVL